MRILRDRYTRFASDALVDAIMNVEAIFFTIPVYKSVYRADNLQSVDNLESSETHLSKQNIAS